MHPCIKICLNFFLRYFVVRTSGKAAAMNEDDQGSWSLDIGLPEVDHLIGVITIGNVFESNLFWRGLRAGCLC